MNVDVLDWTEVSYHGVIGMDILQRLYWKYDREFLVIQDSPLSAGADSIEL